MQISNMSFASFHDCSESVSVICSNMPFWNKYYSSVSHENINLSMPVINIGPWGKDLHKFGERVYKPDHAQRTYSILKFAVSHIYPCQTLPEANKQFDIQSESVLFMDSTRRDVVALGLCLVKARIKARESSKWPRGANNDQADGGQTCR